MDEPIWLTMAILEAIHADLVREHGGALGMRDGTLIESALARSEHRWAYDRDDVDLSDLAAAIGFGLARNHGFVDGNKRTAFMAVYVFLLINGLELDASEAQAVDMMLAVAAGTLSETEFATWIRNSVISPG